MTNVRGFSHPAIDQVLEVATGLGGVARVRECASIVLRCRQFDALLLDNAVEEALLVSAFLGAVRLRRFRIIVTDPVMNPPRGARHAVLARLKRLLLRRVNRFIVHQRDLAHYERLYGISPSRSTYVPFKVNSLDTILTLDVTEGDYVFSCGVTNRDWPTLGMATRDLDVPIVISTPDDAQLRRSGQVIVRPRADDFGPNARFIQNGGDPREWLGVAAGARLVVLPVTSDAINPSGVSTYLSLMALGKCVVISDGPATRGILHDEAIIVPAGNASALRRAILSAWNDASLRRTTAGKGHAYAMMCGDRSRLIQDLARCVLQEIERS